VKEGEIIYRKKNPLMETRYALRELHKREINSTQNGEESRNFCCQGRKYRGWRPRGHCRAIRNQDQNDSPSREGKIRTVTSGGKTKEAESPGARLVDTALAWGFMCVQESARGWPKKKKNVQKRTLLKRGSFKDYARRRKRVGSGVSVSQEVV